METIVPDTTACRLVTLAEKRVVFLPIIAWRVSESGAAPVTTSALPDEWAIVDHGGLVTGHDGVQYASLGRFVSSKARG